MSTISHVTKTSSSYSGASINTRLDKQLVHIQMVNRPTQTDWKWAVMALRWKNARLISSRTDNVKKKWKKAKRCLKFQGHLNKKGTAPADTTGTTDTTASVTSDSISEEGATTLRDEILRRDEDSLSSSKFKQFKRNSSKRLALMRALLDGEENIQDQETLNEIHEDDELSSLGSGNKKKNRRRHKSEPEKHWNIHKNDKYQDTCDLDFDPYDPDLQYTPVQRFSATSDPVPPTPDIVLDVEEEFTENIKELPLSKTQGRKSSVKKRYSTSTLKRKSPEGSKTGLKTNIGLVSSPVGSKNGSKTNIGLKSPAGSKTASKTNVGLKSPVGTKTGSKTNVILAPSPNPLLTPDVFENES